MPGYLSARHAYENNFEIIRYYFGASGGVCTSIFFYRRHARWDEDPGVPVSLAAGGVDGSAGRGASAEPVYVWGYAGSDRCGYAARIGELVGATTGSRSA